MCTVERDTHTVTSTQIFCNKERKMSAVSSSEFLNKAFVCCCCWEQFPVNNKTLRYVNSTVEELMKMYIYPGFSKDVEDFPRNICSNCHRNLFHLKSGKSSRKAWGEKYLRYN